MKGRTIWLLILLAAAGTLVGLQFWKKQPPEVHFVRVTREAISSSVPTNGKVEPITWAVARAERSGAAGKILIHRGQDVAQDAPLLGMDSTEAHADLAAAQARIAQIRADLDLIERGGRATDLAEISSGIDRARLDLQVALKEHDALARLETKQAATAMEVAKAKERVDAAQLQIHSLEQKRAALSTAAPDRAAVQARLQEAEAARALAEQRIRTSLIRAPIGGTVYQFDLKPGAFLNAGDPVATIGRLDRVRVTVYVDEPDLGSVAKGLPVFITWEAKRGRQWNGMVDQIPTQIVALGTRQVGEVVCVIENPDRDLLPGTNVDVKIVAQSVGNALTVPKEAVQNSTVFLLDGDHVVLKKVTVGVSNTTRVQVEGLQDGAAVAVSPDKPLKDGMAVKPVLEINER